MHSYTSYEKPYITERLKAAFALRPLMRVDDITPSLLPENLKQDGNWYNLFTNQQVKQLPVGTVVLDVETSDDTKSLALASAYHLESGDIFYWIAPVGEHDHLLPFPDDSYLVAHRAAFENSFIEQNYQASQPKYRSFCTFAYNATEKHPLKPGLFRAMPYLPMFQKSSDCSLADLYEAATGQELEKSAVEIFITAKGDSWRKEEWEVLLEEGLYEAYLDGKVKLDLPPHLKKVESFKYPSAPRKKADREELWLKLSNQFDCLTHEEKLMFHKLEEVLKKENPYQYLPVVLTKDQYRDQLSAYLNPKHPRLITGLLYNIKDTVATAHVLKNTLSVLPRISNDAFLGIQIRLQPIYAVDPSFHNQRQVAEDKWIEYKKILQEAAEENVKIHHSIADEWDGQDWTVNTKGRTKWYDPKTVGYTKTSNAIASRITYQGHPLKRISAYKPVQLENGDWVFPKESTPLGTLLNPTQLDLTTKKRYWAYNPTIWDPKKESYAEHMEKISDLTAVPLENPESSDTKAFKGIVNFFSKTLLKHWTNGNFACERSNILQLVHIFISTSYWTSIRKRMFALKLTYRDLVWWACPRPSVFGAVSGRSTDPLFLVLSKLDAKKIGSELGGMFVAPPGYKMVAWDLDSCQARIAAIISDAWYAKRMGWEKVKIGVTGISQAVFYGKKEDRSSLAHKLGDSYLGFDLSDPVQADKSYALGKNAQFALIFGVGAEKLAKMLNISTELAWKLVTGWKGVKDLVNPGCWVEGEASDLINAQLALSRRWYPSEGNAAIWEQHQDVLGVVSEDKLPNVLNPRYSEKDYITTKFNAFIQNGDVAMLNYTLAELDRRASHLDFRYCSSIHDYFAFFVKEECVEEFVKIANEVHRNCYEKFLSRWNVDFSTVPDNVWYPSSIDVCRRLVKAVKDEMKENSTTVSFEGYSDLWDHIEIDEEELADLDDEES